MFKLKSLSKKAIPNALEKARRYRLLNEPEQAESVCRDILEIKSDNEEARVELILAMTDQFASTTNVNINKVKKELEHLESDYKKNYYRGIIYEREARATLKRGFPGCKHDAYDEFKEAMEWYEKAEKLETDEKDDTILRWNACAREMMRHNLQQRPKDDYHAVTSE